MMVNEAGHAREGAMTLPGPIHFQKSGPRSSLLLIMGMSQSFIRPGVWLSLLKKRGRFPRPASRKSCQKWRSSAGLSPPYFSFAAHPKDTTNPHVLPTLDV